LVGIQSLANFAKTQGIPLAISLAFAWHLSSETDKNATRSLKAILTQYGRRLKLKLFKVPLQVYSQLIDPEYFSKDG